MRLGIDFGTTRTGVAVCDRGNYPIVSFQGLGGETLDWYPSVVAARGQELVFGIDALRRIGEPGWTGLRSFKRLMSDPTSSMTTSVVVGGAVIQLADLITRFLDTLRQDIQTRSNLPKSVIKSPDIQAIIATPANAHSTQRLMTLEGFKLAGFDVVGMMNEPSAAGVEYAHRFRKSLTTRREKIAVYDLGGGTFDASLVSMREMSHDVIASAGIAKLGGDDFDDVLFQLVLNTAGLDKRQLSSTSHDRLLDHCRDLKERLHPNTNRILVEIGGYLDQIDRTIAGIGVDQTVTVLTADYYEACTPLVERTIEVLDRVLARGGPEADLEDIASVYVVGGASNLPVVGRKLRQRYGRRVKKSQYPAAATAIGLATAFEGDLQVNETLTRSFGVFREAHDGTQVAFDPIFDAAETVPVENGAQVRLYRPVHNIGHFRFVECGWLDADGGPSGDITPYPDVLFPFDPHLQEKECELRKLPVERTPSVRPLIEERYHVDASGIIDVTITDVETGYRRHHKLARALS